MMNHITKTAAGFAKEIPATREIMPPLIAEAQRYDIQTYRGKLSLFSLRYYISTTSKLVAWTTWPNGPSARQRIVKCYVQKNRKI